MVKNYLTTKIYYIPVGNDRYYGYTTQDLSKRKGGHLSYLKNSDAKLYVAAREANVSIQLILVEEFPCNNLDEALAREGYWIEQFGTLNMNRSYGYYEKWWKEWFEQNGEENKQKLIEYRERIKLERELIIQKQKQESREAYARNEERLRPFAEKIRQDEIQVQKFMKAFAIEVMEKEYRARKNRTR
jgi:hypothetical protein